MSHNTDPEHRRPLRENVAQSVGSEAVAAAMADNVPAPAELDAVSRSMGMPGWEYYDANTPARFNPNAGLYIPDVGRTGAVEVFDYRGAAAVQLDGEVFGVYFGQDLDTAPLVNLGAWNLEDEQGKSRLLGIFRDFFHGRKAVDTLTPNITRAGDAAAQEVNRQLEERGAFEYLSTFGKMSAAVIYDMLGVPEEDRAQVSEWLEKYHAVRGWSTPQYAEEEDFYLKLLDDHLRTLGSTPRNLTDMVAMAMKDPGFIVAGKPLSERPRLAAAQLRMLAAAAVGTTREAGGNVIEGFARHGGVFERLNQNPRLQRLAIAEGLRLWPSFLRSPAITKQPARFGDLEVPAETFVEVITLAANRDKYEFGNNANELDITRTHNPHLSFGLGELRYCLGAGLASAVIGEMVRRACALEGVRVDESKPPARRVDGLVNGIVPDTLFFRAGHGEEMSTSP